MIERIKAELSKGVSMEEYANALDALRHELSVESDEIREHLLEAAPVQPELHRWTITEFEPVRSAMDRSMEYRVKAQVPGRSPVWSVYTISDIIVEDATNPLRFILAERDSAIRQILFTPQLFFNGLMPWR